MYEITFENKNTQAGAVKGILRIIGKELFIKVNSYQYSKQLIDQFKNAGCEIEEKMNWIRINLFFTNPKVILGDIEIDSEEETPTAIETKLYNFYMLQYAKAGMIVEGKEL